MYGSCANRVWGILNFWMQVTQGACGIQCVAFDVWHSMHHLRSWVNLHDSTIEKDGTAFIDFQHCNDMISKLDALFFSFAVLIASVQWILNIMKMLISWCLISLFRSWPMLTQLSMRPLCRLYILWTQIMLTVFGRSLSILHVSVVQPYNILQLWIHNMLMQNISKHQWFTNIL